MKKLLATILGAAALATIASAQAPLTTTAPAVPAAPAATVAAPPAGMADDAQYGMSLREAWKYGGNIMYVLSFLSVLGLALLAYLLIVQRPSSIAPRALRLELADKLRAGDMSGARNACEARPCPLASVTLAGLDYLRNAQRADRDMLKDAMES